MVWRDVKHVDPAVLRWVPLELVVPPVLLHPQVGRHDLVLQVLKLPMVKWDRQTEMSIYQGRHHSCEWSFLVFSILRTFSPSLTYHGYELGELQLKFDCDNFRHIWDRPHQFVVIGKEVIVQSLGVWISTKNKHFQGFHIITYRPKPTQLSGGEREGECSVQLNKEMKTNCFTKVRPFKFFLYFVEKILTFLILTNWI